MKTIIFLIFSVCCLCVGQAVPPPPPKVLKLVTMVDFTHPRQLFKLDPKLGLADKKLKHEGHIKKYRIWNLSDVAKQSFLYELIVVAPAKYKLNRQSINGDVVTVDIEKQEGSGLEMELKKFLSTPVVFPETNSVSVSSGYSILVFEDFTQNDYRWSIREFEGDSEEDYFAASKIVERLDLLLPKK